MQEKRRQRTIKENKENVEKVDMNITMVNLNPNILAITLCIEKQ